MQVGYIGLLKAINNFDPGLGGGLAGYAALLSGEIKRHFRDRRWQVQVSGPPRSCGWKSARPPN